MNVFIMRSDRRRFFLCSGPAILTAGLLFATGLCAFGQQSPTPPRPPSPLSESDSSPLRLEHVAHIVGLEGLKPNTTGDLTFDKVKLSFRAGEHSVSIPLRSIVAFSISHDDVALIGGAKGTVAAMAPYGVGQVISAIRPSADTFTFLYRDSFHAIHGSILILPKGTGDNVVTALAEAKITPSEYPRSGEFASAERATEVSPLDRPGPAPSKSSVQVGLLTESVDGIPSAFPVAEYEELVSQLTDSGLFAKVWRQGDIRRDPGALVLHVNVEALKKGSARSRGLVPFTGATVIKTNVTLVDLSGRTVFQANVEGSKRMRGESLDATASLAKKVRKELQKAPDFGSSH
jgi:hypothetical protein